MITHSNRNLCLIISESSFLAQFHSSLIEKQGWKAETIDNFEHAIVRFSEANHDLIILDCPDKRFDALLFVKRVRGRAYNREVPILFIADGALLTLQDRINLKRDGVVLIERLVPQN